MCSSGVSEAAGGEALLAELDDVALAGELVELRRQIDAVEARFLQGLRAFDRRGGGAADGFPSTASWLRGTCRLGPGAAAEAVRWPAPSATGCRRRRTPWPRGS
ncbi:MAG: hypothetical protein M3P96_01865 [Actinomycetota bacterium]|nr:hypothetical protein [Actinomycetota bacterium]